MEKALENTFKNKRILVTGGTGSIGSEIVKNLLKYNPKVIRIFSNDENAVYRMIEELGKHPTRRFLVGDIRDKERLIHAMDEIDIVYHAAALKHVPVCEYNPFEAIKTNVLGTQNIIEAAYHHPSVEKVINISTDKAVNPINTMGATKLLSEKLMIDANYYKGQRKTIFSNVRFGNVLFSRGSVIPLFEEQINQKKLITITDGSMTRFMMSKANTTDLLFKATLMAKGGEIFILKMPVVTLDDLSDVVIEHYCEEFGYQTKEIQKKLIGPRPGEKLFEELMTENEAKSALETEDMLIVLPQVRKKVDIHHEMIKYHKAKRSKLNRYVSRDEPPLSKEEIRKLLFDESYVYEGESPIQDEYERGDRIIMKEV